jgi:hypothetical protein
VSPAIEVRTAQAPYYGHVLGVAAVRGRRGVRTRVRRVRRLSWSLQGFGRPLGPSSSVGKYVVVRPDVFADTGDTTTISTSYDPMPNSLTPLQDEDTERDFGASWMSAGPLLTAVPLMGPESLASLPRAKPNVWIDVLPEDE